MKSIFGFEKMNRGNNGRMRLDDQSGRPFHKKFPQRGIGLGSLFIFLPFY